MDKTIVGVIGAVTGLASLDGAAQAATAPPPDALPAARSYADLLDPIPNAVAMLQAADTAAAARAAQQPAGDDVQVAQVYIGVGHHHHHHHHRYWRHHHHHHHHRVIIIHRHHHHHHHY
jgi:hypothetical protein